VSSSAAVIVLKIGGSVLIGADAYRRAAAFVRSLGTDPGVRVVAVVSAEHGHTDALLAEARGLAEHPDPDVLALLWSTGELRSVALLTLALHATGVCASALNVHECGVRVARHTSHVDLNTLTIRAALGQSPVVIVPGFLATSGPRVVTLGRGGSDLSAVLLAAALKASRCVLLKDVDGYYTDDPRRCAGAELIRELSYDDALTMADAGCPLVHRQAIVEARERRVHLVVRSFESWGTQVGETTPGVVLQRT
jgi:aspartate kinase